MNHQKLPKKGRNQGEKRGAADGSAVPQNSSCIFLLCFPIVQEAEKRLKLNLNQNFKAVGMEVRKNGGQVGDKIGEQAS